MQPFTVIPLKDVPFENIIRSEESRKLNVLVVDDEQVIADTLSVILEKNGFDAMTAYDGEAAMEMAMVTPHDLLLSDVMMGPGMDGVELAVAVSEEFPTCKVLLFSGHAATRDLLERAGEKGRNFTLLSKPLYPSDLLARIRQTFAEETVAAD